MSFKKNVSRQSCAKHGCNVDAKEMMRASMEMLGHEAAGA